MLHLAEDEEEQSEPIDPADLEPVLEGLAEAERRELPATQRWKPRFAASTGEAAVHATGSL
jgi:hypothetical protein